MIACSFNRSSKHLTFKDFPQGSLPYAENDTDGCIPLNVTDEKTAEVALVFLKENDLREIGISISVWKHMQNNLKQLQRLLAKTAKIASCLQKAAEVVSKHVGPESLEFFTEKRPFATQLIMTSFCDDLAQRTPKTENAPGVYFVRTKESVKIFINLKGSNLIGTGTYSRVKKVLHLVGDQSQMLAVKKVYRRINQNAKDAADNEFKALNAIGKKTGVISVIAGRTYDNNKSIVLFPMYECNLSNYLKNSLFELTIHQKLSVAFQLLKGLLAISEKGIHGDLAAKKMLLKRGGDGEVEAVISGFAAFCLYGHEKWGLTSPRICSPEYLKDNIVSSAQDVWALGIALLELFSDKPLLWLEKDKLEQISAWHSELVPGWSLDCPLTPEAPEFLSRLISDMLNPICKDRISAGQALEEFSVGSPSFRYTQGNELKQIGSHQGFLSESINAEKMELLLQRAAKVALKHLTSEFLSFFTDRSRSAASFIASMLSSQTSEAWRSSNIRGMPGMYFIRSPQCTNIFVNLKKTEPLGKGSFGTVRKVLWLTAPDSSQLLVAKKVCKNNHEKTIEAFEKELKALQEFPNKMGIISGIVGGVYGKKRVLFLPIYACSLSAYLKNPPFELTMNEKLSMASQLLSGLLAVSEKGIHRDLSAKNLLLKKGEAVICDFGSFKFHDKEDYGASTRYICPPEWFKEQITSPASDVWAMGVCLHRLLSSNPFPWVHLNESGQIGALVSPLTPGWASEYPLAEEAPQFLSELISDMLNPNYEERISAKETFERFSSSYLEI